MRETAATTMFGTPVQPFEVRAAGRFSASEVREILNGQPDLRQLGCPTHLFIKSLEKRVASRVRTSDADRLRHADTVARAIKADEAKGKLLPVTDADRRARLQHLSDTIRFDEAQEYLLDKQFY